MKGYEIKLNLILPLCPRIGLFYSSNYHHQTLEKNKKNIYFINKYPKLYKKNFIHIINDINDKEVIHL